MRSRGKIAILCLMVLASAGLIYAWKAGWLMPGPAPAPAKAPPPVVETDRVGTGRVVDIRESVGTVRAFESITVTAKVSGVVQNIAFDEGQKVKAGDILVTFDTDERKADIEQNKAEALKAVAQRDEARQKLERARTLQKTGAGALAQVEDLTAQLRVAEGAIASAEAKSKAAEARLDDVIIRAPFDGRLGSRAVSLGAYVSPGTRITTLDDLSKVRLDFAVPENVAGFVKPGQTVRARASGFQDRIFTGTVALIDPRVDPLTRSLRMTADFDNPDESLKPGMFLAVALEVTTNDNAVLIPEEAVVGEGMRQLAYIVKDGKIERRTLKLGQRQNGKVEIVEGLSAGETIVVRGVQRIRPGQEVTAKPISPAPQSNAEPVEKKS